MSPRSERAPSPNREQPLAVAPLVSLPATGPGLEAARDALNAHGFVRLEQAVPEPVVERLKQNLDAAFETAARRGATDVHRDARGVVVHAAGIDKHSDFIFDLARSPELLEFARALVSCAGSPGVIPLKAEYFDRSGPGAAPIPPHQDQAFHNSHFDDELAVALWCPLTEIAADDGPLEFGLPAVPPWQLLPHLPSNTPHCDRRLGAGHPDGYVPVPARPGDMIAYHAYAVHRSAHRAAHQSAHRAAAGSSRRPWKAFVMNFRSSPYPGE